MLRHDMSHVLRTRAIARKNSSEMPNYSILSCSTLPCHYYFSLVLPCPVLSCPVLYCPVQLQSALLVPNLFCLTTKLCPTPPFSAPSFLFLPHPARSALLIPTLHCPDLDCVELHICTCMRNAFIYRSPTCRIIFPPQPSVLATKKIKFSRINIINRYIIELF